jgi:hypothetical protein
VRVSNGDYDRPKSPDPLEPLEPLEPKLLLPVDPLVLEP